MDVWLAGVVVEKVVEDGAVVEDSGVEETRSPAARTVISSQQYGRCRRD